MAALRRREDTLDAGELLRGLEHARLLYGARLHISVVVELAKHAAHAVEAQTAGVVGGGDEAAAERVHLRERADLAGVTEVVGVNAAGEAGAGGGLDGDEAVVGFAAQLLAHERRDQSAEIAAAAGAADDNVGLHTVLIECGFGLKTDDALVQQHLVENASEHVAVTGVRCCHLDGLADRAAERAGRAGVLGKDAAADLRFHRGGRRHARAVGSHDLAAERFLLVADLHHEHLAVQPQIRARHRKRGAPLPGAGLGRHTLEPLLFRVIRLRDGAVELVTAGGVVALKLVVDLRGRVERLFETVGAHERGGTVHLVKAADLLRNGDERRVVVQLLLNELFAEYTAELCGGHGLARTGIEQRRGLVFHVRAKIVPCLRHIGFVEIDLVGDVFAFHDVLLLFC